MLVTFGNAGVQQTCEFFLYVQRLFGMRTNMLRFSSSVEVWSSKMRWNFLCSSERHTSSCELVKKYTLDSSSRRVLDLATCWLFLSQSQHYTNTTLRFCWSWTAPLTCCGYLQIRVIKRMIPVCLSGGSVKHHIFHCFVLGLFCEWTQPSALTAAVVKSLWNSLQLQAALSVCLRDNKSAFYCFVSQTWIL